jgi:hypothetical protein
MALSNLDKNNLTRLFKMINIDNENQNNIIDIRSNHTAVSKLQLIAKQIEFLKQEANDILNNYNISIEINKIKSNFKKVPGNNYYIYENNNEKFISLISPDEWNNYEKFISKVYLDYDYNYYIIS